MYRTYQQKQDAGEPLTELEKATKEKLDSIKKAGKMRELQDEMNQNFVESPTLGQYFENG